MSPTNGTGGYVTRPQPQVSRTVPCGAFRRGTSRTRRVLAGRASARTADTREHGRFQPSDVTLPASAAMHDTVRYELPALAPEIDQPVPYEDYASVTTPVASCR